MLPQIAVEGGISEQVAVKYQGEFRYLDVKGSDLSSVKKVLELPEKVQAPIVEGSEAGKAKYFLNGSEIGSVPIVFAESMEKAVYFDYLRKIFSLFLLQRGA